MFFFGDLLLNQANDVYLEFIAGAFMLNQVCYDIEFHIASSSAHTTRPRG